MLAFVSPPAASQKNQARAHRRRDAHAEALDGFGELVTDAAAPVTRDRGDADEALDRLAIEARNRRLALAHRGVAAREDLVLEIRQRVLLAFATLWPLLFVALLLALGQHSDSR